MDESTWNLIQTVAAVVVLALIGYTWVRDASGGPWIRIRGRNRHRIVTARELWYDPRRWSRRSSTGLHGHPGGGGSSPADDGDGGGIGGGADCGDGGDGGGGGGGCD